MFNYKIKFVKKPDAIDLSDENALELIEDYWSVLHLNGQTVGGFDVYKDGEFIYLTTVVPTEEALLGNFDNEYVRVRLGKINEFFTFEVILEGENLEYKDSCSCEKPTWYYLYSNGKGESPLVCGDCDKPFPLYKITQTRNNKEHDEIIGWALANDAMHKLWIHGLWDRFTYREMSMYNSKLNREGRKICKEFEKTLGIAVYHYIYCFYEQCSDDECSIVPKGLPNMTPPVCPQCGGEWTDDSIFCKCEKCRLIADSRVHL